MYTLVLVIGPIINFRNLGLVSITTGIFYNNSRQEKEA